MQLLVELLAQENAANVALTPPGVQYDHAAAALACTFSSVSVLCNDFDLVVMAPRVLIADNGLACACPGGKLLRIAIGDKANTDQALKAAAAAAAALTGPKRREADRLVELASELRIQLCLHGADGVQALAKFSGALGATDYCGLQEAKEKTYRA